MQLGQVCHSRVVWRLWDTVFFKRPPKKNVSAMGTANTPISVNFQDIFTRFSNQDWRLVMLLNIFVDICWYLSFSHNQKCLAAACFGVWMILKTD